MVSGSTYHDLTKGVTAARVVFPGTRIIKCRWYCSISRSDNSHKLSSSEYGVIEETSLKGVGMKMGMSASPSCSLKLSLKPVDSPDTAAVPAETDIEDGTHCSRIGSQTSASAAPKLSLADLLEP